MGISIIYRNHGLRYTLKYVREWNRLIYYTSCDKIAELGQKYFHKIDVNEIIILH